MNEQKEFSLGAVLSLTGGKLLCKFGDMQECAEFVLGHPIWTHEFADRKTVDALKAAVLAQHPQLAEVNVEDVTSDNWREKLDGFEARYGRTLTLTRGATERTESPLESILRMIGGGA